MPTTRHAPSQLEKAFALTVLSWNLDDSFRLDSPLQRALKVPRLSLHAAIAALSADEWDELSQAIVRADSLVGPLSAAELLRCLKEIRGEAHQ